MTTKKAAKAPARTARVVALETEIATLTDRAAAAERSIGELRQQREGVALDHVRGSNTGGTSHRLRETDAALADATRDLEMVRAGIAAAQRDLAAAHAIAGNAAAANEAIAALVSERETIIADTIAAMLAMYRDHARLGEIHHEIIAIRATAGAAPTDDRGNCRYAPNEYFRWAGRLLKAGNMGVAEREATEWRKAEAGVRDNAMIRIAAHFQGLDLSAISKPTTEEVA